ncbi:hypothetical protein ACKKBF_B16950 [Auxenochlorella protothecoides x Auxenochlorella symbiontica]
MDASPCVLSSPQHTTLDKIYPPQKFPRLEERPKILCPLRHVRQRGAAKRVPPLSGYLGLLPMETLEQILGYCTPRQLGALESSCSFFIKSGITDKVAMHHLSFIPRAKGLKPDFKHGESYVTLYAFVTAQSNAAAQGTALALGTYHTVALLSSAADRAAHAEAAEYALHTTGRGFHGQLGLGDYEQRLRPTRVPGVARSAGSGGAGSGGAAAAPSSSAAAADAVQLAVVAAGSSHTASISRRGELFTWGLASSGELGHGGWTPIEVCAPRLVGSLHRVRVVSVAAGANHTLAISEAGQLWSCGRGRHGQLGHGAFHDEGVLTLVEATRGERVVSAAAGRAHSLALAADGRLFSWGDARWGQLGHPSLARLAAPEGSRPGEAPQPIAIPYPQPVAAVDPARLRAPARVTAIAAGGDHSMAVTVGGALLAFGANRAGQLGLGDAADRHVPTPVALDAAASDAAAGCAAARDAPGAPPPAPARAVQVVCGAAHSVALVSVAGRMEVRAAGDGAYGQRGTGDRGAARRFLPLRALRGAGAVCVASGDWHSAAVGADGGLYTWGRGDCGQLGLGDDRARWEPARVPGVAVVHPDRTLRRNRRPAPRNVLLAAGEGAR